MEIYKDLDKTKEVAIKLHQENKRNYNVIIINPVNGKFDKEQSEYNIVDDTYFLQNRPLIKFVCKTKDLIKDKK
ncbi:MAG: hypothetical protein V4547_18220 [Bacteroidota bacterium]